MENKHETNMSAMLGNILGPVSDNEGGGGKPTPPPSGVSGATPTLWTPDDPIPQPNYGDSASRLKYSQRFVKKYGPLLEKHGDTFLNVDETPRGGSSSIKNISVSAAKAYKIDPSLLYASASEEGLSGLFKSKATGLDTKGRKSSDPDYMDFFGGKAQGDNEYPISKASLGLDTLVERLPDLIKGGYLPKGFEKNIRMKDGSLLHDAGNLKTVEAGMVAKAAMVKYHLDDVDKYAKEEGIKLSPKAREFFALVGYNGGEGTAKKMIKDYNNNGYLDDDKFMTSRPTSGKGLKEESYKDVYNHVAVRFKVRQALQNEGLFKKDYYANADSK